MFVVAIFGGRLFVGNAFASLWNRCHYLPVHVFCAFYVSLYVPSSLQQDKYAGVLRAG